MFQGSGWLVDIEAVRAIKRWKPQPWATTPAQEKAAWRLAEIEGGGYVHIYADGRAELLTMKRGSLRRHIIHQNGETALVESGPESPRYKLSQRLWPAGMLLALGAFGLGALAEERMASTALFWLGLIGLLLGLAMFAAGVVIFPRLPSRQHLELRPDEHWIDISPSE